MIIQRANVSWNPNAESFDAPLNSLREGDLQISQNGSRTQKFKDFTFLRVYHASEIYFGPTVCVKNACLNPRFFFVARERVTTLNAGKFNWMPTDVDSFLFEEVC